MWARLGLLTGSGRGLVIQATGWVKAMAEQFFPDGGSRHTQPLGGFRLVAARQLNCLAVELVFHRGGNAGVRIFKLAAHDPGQDVRNVSCKALIHTQERARGLNGLIGRDRLLNVRQVNDPLRGNESAANHVSSSRTLPGQESPSRHCIASG